MKMEGMTILNCITSIITAVTAVTTIYYNRKNIKERNEFEAKQSSELQDFQDKLQKNKIDADLKAKARIDWISDVRIHTANLMTEYYNLKIAHYENKTKNDVDDILENSKAFSKFKNEINILRLYFQNKELVNYDSEKLDLNGEMQPMDIYTNPLHDSMEERNERAKKKAACTEVNQAFLKPLYNTESNKGKHGRIVRLLKDIETNVGFIGPKENRPDSKYLSSTRGFAATKVMDKYMEEFAIIIGIYLKIEWDIAKEGK